MFNFIREKLASLRKKAKEDLGEDYFSEGLGKRIKESRLDEFLWDLEMALLEADVAYEVVEELKAKVRERLLGKRVKRGVSVEDAVMSALKEALMEVLSPSRTFDFWEFMKTAEKPVVIMFVGINGTGKTTAIAKVAHMLQKRGYSVVLSASDTFRAGAIEQITEHANRLGVKVIKHSPGGDPAAVAYDAIEHAKARKRDAVLIDTAGRIQTNRNLMDEMKKIKRVAKPHLVIFVGDALAGNDAVEQARAFDEAVGVDGIILTKVDADAKGGAAISISHAIGKPVLWLGVGQGYEDLIPFDPAWLIDRIFG